MRWYAWLGLAVCVAMLAGFTHGVAYQAGLTRGALDSALRCAREGGRP